MKLSVIVVSFNTEKLTLDCIHSIYKHEPSFSFEVIVVDNASHDGTVNSLRKLKYKNLLIIENKLNLGFSKANNIGIQASTGEYVLLLNSDTVVVSNLFEELVNFSEVHPDAGVVAPKLLNKDKSLQPSTYKLPTVIRAIKEYWFGQKGLLQKQGYDSNQPVKVEVVVGAAFLITPLAKKRIGGLDEKYFMYFEDFDYCRKVREKGLEVYYLPTSFLIHLHGASGDGKVSKLLVESSKKYFGFPKYYIYTFVLWSGQKLSKVLYK